MLAIIFVILALLYVAHDLLGRKLTIKGLDKKAVLITGCGNGFGRDLVKRCLLNGLTVFAGCRREISVKELEESYGSISQGRLYAFQMDVADDESVRKSRKLVDSVLREKGLVLHALVNNAGVGGKTFYDDFLIIDDFKETWDVNVLGVIRVTHTFRDLIKKSRGRIVMCGSACTLFTVPSHSPYSSSKYGLHAYTTVIRHELQPYGVEVIEIAPGAFETGMQDKQRIFDMIDSVWNRAPQEVRDEIGKNYVEEAKSFYEKLRVKMLEDDITWVIDAYYEAIVARRPKLLYRVGWDALIQFYPYSFFPVRLQVFVMKLLLRASGAPIPAILKTNAHSYNKKRKSN